MAHLQVIKGGEAMGMGLADFIWLDEDGDLCVKKRSILIGKDERGDPAPIVDRWSINSAVHGNLILVPCNYLPDPTRPEPSYIVLCEVRGEDDVCKDWNHRAKLRDAMDDRGKQANLVWFGFEQKYELDEQGDSENDVFEARRFLTAERHIGACFDAGILFHSAWNDPAASDGWDFKVGVRGFPQDLDPDPPNALVVSDHLIIARYLMEKVAAGKGLAPDWDSVDIQVSTAALREPGAEQNAVLEEMEDRLRPLDGKTRRVPHPSRGNCRCIELGRDDPADPYILAHDVLTAVWPLETLKAK